ncbi:MAG TPA: argininosuccinate lyase [Chitinophagaceae bacterium]|nr:argininosuccinate lyase [Chitinophagaceae bacterium]
MKLWQKNKQEQDRLVEKFTVGNDQHFDLLLARYDVLGSLAHTTMLAKVGLLTPEELSQIHQSLQEIKNDIEAGDFVIAAGVEDIHSQVELLLTQKIGEAGKKIHSGRSRNDQVAVDIKLYLKDEMRNIKDACATLFHVLIGLSTRHQDVLMPGLTHFQLAMPSSFGLWFSAYAESLSEDLELLHAAYSMADRNPLGSGAGYGSSFPLDRTETTTLLGFSRMHYNAINAQMSRGKTEKYTAIGIAAIGATLARLSMDICLYMNQNFGFVSFPDTLTTGSSIMPHKKNPDIFELVRAKCNTLQAVPNELALLMNNLPSGYHRDMQLTKEIIFPAIEKIKDCLQILIYALPQIQVRQDILADDRYQQVFTVETVSELVLQGMPFRDAYKVVGEQVEQGVFRYERFHISRHTHEGSMGNLCNEAIVQQFAAVLSRFEA